MTLLDILTPNVAANSTLSVDVSSLPFQVQVDSTVANVIVQLYNASTALTQSTSLFTVTGSVTTGTFIANEPVTQANSNASANLIGTVTGSGTMMLGTITGTADNNDIWTGTTSGATYTPTATPVGVFEGNISIQNITTPTQAVVIAQGPEVDGNIPSLANIQFYIVFYNDQNLAALISPPSGFSCFKQQSNCMLQWVTPPYQGLLGVRIQISTDPTGVTVPYTQVGNLVNTVSSSSNTLMSTVNTNTVNTPDQNIPGQYTLNYNVTETYLTTTYGSVTISSTYVNSDIFYAVASTVIQDPVSNQVYESQQIGPITCGFVNLSAVNPTDFLALQRKEDIAQRMISQIIRVYPDLDLTPHSENRDLFIDPIAIEISNMSVRQWFSLCCQSIDALAQIDNASGNGFSDPVSSSPVKQQLANAFGLNSNDIQTYINHAFDVAADAAGLTRGGPTTSTGVVTFYTYVQPTVLMTISEGAVVATIADASTASLNFTVAGTAVIDPKFANNLYNAEKGWWSVDVPVFCQTAGSIGTVGAGSIRQTVSGVPQGLSCINQLGTSPAVDTELNSRLAARIKNKELVGVDTGTRYGYWGQAINTPGIVQATVVAAGDDEMLRDWLPADISDSGLVIERPGKHIFGCVDVYTRGTAFSEQVNEVVYNYTQTGLLPLKLIVNSLGVIQFSVTTTEPLYTVLQISVTQTLSGKVVYLGTQLCQISNQNGNASIFINPTEYTYTITNGVSTPTSQTNLQFMTGISTSTVTFALSGRYQDDIYFTPPEQPILSINSVVGPITGAISPSSIQLVYTQDFLLAGGSNQAGDVVQVDSTQTSVQQTTLVFTGVLTDTGPTYLLIDSNMVMTISSNGEIIPPSGFTVTNAYDPVGPPYVFGVDYTISAAGPYLQYYLQLTNNSSILTQPGIPLNGSPSVIVTYYKYILTEHVNLQTDTLTLTGVVPSYLSQDGFIYNTWLPNSYGLTTLTSDVALSNAGVALTSRYIKVVYNNGTPSVPNYIVLQENRDFTLNVSAASGQTTITAIVGGASQMPMVSGGVSLPLTITYYYSEVFAISTQIPTWVDQLANNLAVTKHADADVLVKAQVASPVDITMTVTVSSTATISTVDNLVRSAIGVTLNNANTSLNQALLVQQVMAQPGVTNVNLPLTKCAKSNGAYDIGFVIPSTTPWVQSTDPTISLYKQVYYAPGVLQNSTLDSGGPPNAYVGFLYESQPFARALSQADFDSRSDVSFYLTATGDIWIRIPAYQNSPNDDSYFCTYQVWNEEGAKDITTSSTEYLSPGNITINYIVGTTN
jgi:hypothetical protein